MILKSFVLVCTICALSARGSEGDYAARRLAEPPAIDGRLDEWKGCPRVAMKQPNVPDLKVELTIIGWDSNALYVAVHVVDGAIVNTQSLERLANGDCLELRVCPAATGAESFVRLCVAPSSATGKPACRATRHQIASKAVTALRVADAPGGKSAVQWAIATDKKGWSVEAAIPFAMLGVAPVMALRLPFVLVVWDRDRTDVDEWAIGGGWHKRSENASQKAPPDQWPCLTLADASVAEPLRVASGVTIERHRPCNLFTPAENVALPVRLKGFPAGTGEATGILSDARGKEVGRRSCPVATQAGSANSFTLDMGQPGRGYYALKVEVKVRAADGQAAEGSGTATLGVMEFANRTAAEVRAQDYRFGLKWWGGVTDKPETLEMMAKLGLQWTRVILAEAPPVLTNVPMNAVIKIERFPRELYDEARYGKLEEWEKKYGRGAWTLKTLPKKEAYQAWLAEGLRTVAKEHNVFEIWNEPWDKMSPEDFATISQWIAEVVRRDRPDAILGQNLRGDMSEYGYDAKVAKAGGLKGMNMVCLHPYGSSENREWLRAYRKWLSGLAGHDMAVYVTEYGSHSCPAGPAKRSEIEQARAVVRQSLALYAEDVKALIPHWVGQSEQNPTYHEDWFGYIRRNQEPKPVLLAHANSARLIDGGRYLGDLWFGPGVGAMLFAKGGVNTLALWTQGETTNVVVEPGSAQVVVVDMFGAATERKVENGKLALSVGPDLLYVTGVGSALAQQASPELRADRWPKPAKAPRDARTIHRLRAVPTCDGKLDEWQSATQLALINPKVNGDDASGTGYLAWDDQFLYLAVAVRDNEILNTKPRAKLYQHDSLELFISTAPRETDAGYGPNDRQYFITPTSGEGKPVVAALADREAGVLTDVAGAKYFVGKAGAGWVAEVALPWSAIPPFQPKAGAKAALEIRVNDADTSHERWKIDPIDGNVRPEDPTAWSLLVLEE